MITTTEYYNVPVIVDNSKKGTVEIYIPDFSMSVFGKDYIEAFALANLRVTAVHMYNVEHNLKLENKYSYNDVENMSLRRGKGSFATFLSLEDWRLL